MRHGHEDGEITLGGRRVGVQRPRARTADGEHEVSFATYAHFADRDPLTRVVLEQMLAGVSTRRVDAGVQQAHRGGVAHHVRRQGRYQTVRDNLRVKEVRIGEGDAAKRFVICHNPAEGDRERTQREDTIRRLEAELERIAKQHAKTKSTKGRRRASDRARRGAPRAAAPRAGRDALR